MNRISPDARRIAIIVAAAMFMQMLDGVIIATALPDMARSFGVRPLDMSVGVTSYMLASAIFIPIAGWLADRFGPQRIFLLAIALFTLASIACGLAQNLPQFVIARSIQGIGGAFMIPVGRLIVLRTAKKQELVEAIALITWPALIAPVIGPALGGAITTYLTWRWNFFINLPLGLVGMGLVLAFIPDSPERDPRPLDWLGFILTGVSLGSLLYGLECLSHAEGDYALPVGLSLLGLVTGAMAIRHLYRAKVPLLDLRAFRHRTFAISNLFGGGYARMAINATPFLLPLLFQVSFGLDPLQAGGLTIAYFAGNLAMKTVTTWILRRFGFRNVLLINGVLSTISIGACGALMPDTSYGLVLGILFCAGLTRSMQFTALNTIAFADVDASERSSASTLSSMLQQVSMVLGVAVAALVLNASQAAGGRQALALIDFQITFAVIALLALISAALMLRLPVDAGAEVSGHVQSAR
ncbi:MAG: DHA2 family efflux MFS transporter permease subunit [Cypionkella sp.]